MTSTTHPELSSVSTPTEVVNAFPEFYGNPVIRQMAGRRAWAVTDNNKRPVSIPPLITTGDVIGASLYSLDTDAVTLAEMVAMLPQATNCAYYFDTLVEKHVILDIEADCPPHVADELLTLLPLAAYSEVSRSGKGYHLVLPLPDNFYELPKLSTIPVKIQHPDRSHEVLLNHWITYTRIPIPPERTRHLDFSRATPTLWAEIFADLVDKAPLGQRPTHTTHESQVFTQPLEALSTTQPPEEADIDYQIISHVNTVFDERYNKTPEDFNNDMSRWEYSQLSFLVKETSKSLTTHKAIAEALSVTTGINPITTPAPEHVARMTYQLAQDLIPHREKHTQERQGMPFLLYQIVALVEQLYAPAPPVHTNHQPHPPKSQTDSPSDATVSPAETPSHHNPVTDFIKESGSP